MSADPGSYQTHLYTRIGLENKQHRDGSYRAFRAVSCV